MDRDQLAVGDIIKADGEYWRIVAGDTERTLGPGVCVAQGVYKKDGKVLAYAARDLIRHDYHEIIPAEVVAAWTQVTSDQLAINQPLTTNNNDNNVNKEKEV